MGLGGGGKRAPGPAAWLSDGGGVPAGPQALGGVLGSAGVFLGVGGRSKPSERPRGLCAVLDQAQVAEEDRGLERHTSWPSARPQVNQCPGAQR